MGNGKHWYERESRECGCPNWNVERGIAHLDREFNSLKDFMVETLNEMKNGRAEERGEGGGRNF